MAATRRVLRVGLLGLVLLAQAAFLPGRVALGEEPVILVSTAGKRWQLQDLVVDADGWHLRTADGTGTDLEPRLVISAYIGLPEECPAAVLLTRDGEERHFRRGQFRGRQEDLNAAWLVSEGQGSKVIELNAADVVRVEVGDRVKPGPTPTAARAHDSNPVIMRFEADIDYGHIICVRADRLWVKRWTPFDWHTSRGPIRNMHYTLARPLPSRFGCYYLGDLEIDGEARWGLSQPVSENGYTLSVEVRDWADGYHRLSFTLRECVDPDDPPPPAPGIPLGQYATRQVSLIIPARAAWWDTGWEVEPGSEVSIHCTGRWQVYCRGNYHTVEPNGVRNMTDSGHVGPPLAALRRCGQDASRALLLRRLLRPADTEGRRPALPVPERHAGGDPRVDRHDDGRRNGQAAPGPGETARPRLLRGAGFLTPRRETRPQMSAFCRTPRAVLPAARRPPARPYSQLEGSASMTSTPGGGVNSKRSSGRSGLSSQSVTVSSSTSHFGQ